MGENMEARLLQPNENMDNQEYLYIESREKRDFFYDEWYRITECYGDKIYDKDKNTIYGHAIELVELEPSKLIYNNSSDGRIFRAIKIGHMYILESKDMAPMFGIYSGYSLEELYQELISNEELLSQINPLIVEYGYDAGIQTCKKYNMYSIHKGDPVIREV